MVSKRKKKKNELESDYIDFEKLFSDEDKRIRSDIVKTLKDAIVESSTYENLAVGAFIGALLFAFTGTFLFPLLFATILLMASLNSKEKKLKEAESLGGILDG